MMNIQKRRILINKLKNIMSFIVVISFTAVLIYLIVDRVKLAKNKRECAEVSTCICNKDKETCECKYNSEEAQKTVNCPNKIIPYQEGNECSKAFKCSCQKDEPLCDCNFKTANFIRKTKCPNTQF